MNKKNVTHKSAALDREMELVVYGTAGQPIVVFPTQGQPATSLEDVGMVDELSDYLDNGVVQLFCASVVDDESWAAEGDAAERAERQEAYYRYVCDELVPLVRELAKTDARPLALGCDLGALHAAVVTLRRPDLFQGCVSLSGSYDARRYFGDWMDATLYENVPCAFLANMPADHPYVAAYNQRQLLFCTGQEASEADSLRTTRLIDAELRRLGVEAWCDYWGGDVSHHWFWWKKQIRYFLPIVLEDVEKTTAAEKAAAPKKAARKPAAKRAATTKAAGTKAASAKKAAAAAEKAAPEPKAAAKKPAAKRATSASAATKAAAPAKPAATKAAAAKKAAAPAEEKAAEPTKRPAAAKAPAKKPAAKATSAKLAAEPAKPADAPAKTTPLAKAEKAATPAKAVKPAVPAKAEKAAVPAKAEKAAVPAKATKASAPAKKPAAPKAAAAKAAPAAEKASEAEAPAAKPAAKRTTKRGTTDR